MKIGKYTVIYLTDLLSLVVYMRISTLYIKIRNKKLKTNAEKTPIQQPARVSRYMCTPLYNSKGRIGSPISGFWIKSHTKLRPQHIRLNFEDLLTTALFIKYLINSSHTISSIIHEELCFKQKSRSRVKKLSIYVFDCRYICVTYLAIKFNLTSILNSGWKF